VIRAKFQFKKPSQILFPRNSYFCRMNPLRYFVLILLTAFASVRFNIFAQDVKPDGSKSRQEFKVIEETKDYILKECDSGYYYSHGMKEKNLFKVDSSLLFMENGLHKLKMGNGKFATLKGPESFKSPEDLKFDEYYGYNKKAGYYLFRTSLGEPDIFYLTDDKNEYIEFAIESPLISPGFKYYYKGLFARYNGMNGIEVVNFKTKKKIQIKTTDEFLHQIKWINDDYFLFYTNHFDQSNGWKHVITYYLVQIKQ